jgi:putative membrane protein
LILDIFKYYSYTKINADVMKMTSKDYYWLIITIVIVGLAISLIGSVWNPLMLGMSMGMMGFGWGFMFIIPLVFLVFIILGVYLLIPELSRKNRSVITQREIPLDILKERYAKGEITHEQYLKMKEELQ